MSDEVATGSLSNSRHSSLVGDWCKFITVGAASSLALACLLSYTVSYGRSAQASKLSTAATAVSSSFDDTTIAIAHLEISSAVAYRSIPSDEAV